MGDFGEFRQGDLQDRALEGLSMPRGQVASLCAWGG